MRIFQNKMKLRVILLCIFNYLLSLASSSSCHLIDVHCWTQVSRNVFHLSRCFPLASSGYQRQFDRYAYRWETTILTPWDPNVYKLFELCALPIATIALQSFELHMSMVLALLRIPDLIT